MIKTLWAFVFLSIFTLNVCGNGNKYSPIDCSSQPKLTLSFQLVNEKGMSSLPKSFISKNPQCYNCLKHPLTETESTELLAILKKQGIILSKNPDQSSLYPHISYDKHGQLEIVGQLILYNHIELAIDDLVRAGIVRQGNNAYQTIIINLNAPGTRKIEELSVSNIKKRIAFLLNNQVIIAPVIQSKIGAKFQISLGRNVTKEEGIRIYCGIRNSLK